MLATLKLATSTALRTLQRRWRDINCETLTVVTVMLFFMSSCIYHHTNNTHWQIQQTHLDYYNSVLLGTLADSTHTPWARLPCSSGKTHYFISEWVCSVLRPSQHSIGYMGDGFTGQKTQPTVSKYWRRCYKGQSKQRKQPNTHIHIYTYERLM